MTVVINTNLVINIAKKRKANLDLSIAMVKLAKHSLSLSLSLLPDGFIGLAGVAMLINITNSSSLSLPPDGFMGLAEPQCL